MAESTGPRYIAIAAYEPDILTEKVNHLLDQGYELAGPLIVQEVGGPDRLIQPLLRSEGAAEKART